MRASALDGTINELIGLTVDTEPQLRTMLRLSLEPGPHQELLLRQAARSGGSTKALAPLQARLDPAELHRLVIAIRAALRIEALVWAGPRSGSIPPGGVRADGGGRRSRSCERRSRKPTSAHRTAVTPIAQ